MPAGRDVVRRRNTVEKWLVLRNPTSRPMSPTGRLDVSSGRDARSMRARTTKRWRGSPLLCLKSRAR